ncbi:MAG: glycogen/starch synthase [Ferruginibacter sp.]
MEIIHVSAECYPMAKAGGLADVVGALPKYQNKLGHVSKVVMPMHRTKFLYEHKWEVVHKGSFGMGTYNFDFTIIKELENVLDFDLYCVDINGMLDREEIYNYNDDTERFVSFQIAVMEWISKWEHKPDIIHVHDHHAALIPFMLKNCFVYTHISNIKTVLTIHNAQYQGWMGWEKATYLPAWDTWKWGLLDWDNVVNPLACGIKCADRITTVSPGYMQELMIRANGLESLFNNESYKCSGIINGIDYSVWNPLIDTFILDNYSVKDVKAGKELNKKKLCDDFKLNQKLPLIVFIGRLVQEKAADLLTQAISIAFEKTKGRFSFIILGSGDKTIENSLLSLRLSMAGFYEPQLGYNEKLSHLMYAGADFLLMPSRVEPCGLNQLYAMRYGTVPVVRKTGGLKDTVIDYENEGGYGITFENATVEDIVHSIERVVYLYKDKKKMEEIIIRMMGLNNSWEESAEKYIDVYQN